MQLLCLKKNTFKPCTNKNLFDDIDISNFTLGACIGKGSYAVVKSCVPKTQHDWKLAIKTYEKFRLKEPQKMKSLIREVNILKSIRHPNILRLLFTVEDKR
jgi:MAP/microtubule affinity-regulating kinase